MTWVTLASNYPIYPPDEIRSTGAWKVSDSWKDAKDWAERLSREYNQVFIREVSTIRESKHPRIWASRGSGGHKKQFLSDAAHAENQQRDPLDLL